MIKNAKYVIDNLQKKHFVKQILKMLLNMRDLKLKKYLLIIQNKNKLRTIKKVKFLN